ncbi:hypothetical protein PRUB_b0410 [Pseudoalteromonas rubra]|uniref:Uncharacterized protein n=1 Tax=Pseudoalteromonas rubra TaxID=43658 RepID=A0A8T0BZ38_9GAMM|nr:hypothetical protein [Pseudoalteromonas rubra]KAF7781253.1 hypothetical protein PRUB_b0410 [Pseudoalteromonas rubra]
MSGIIESVTNFFAPGLEESQKAQIKVVAKGDGTFKVPMESLKNSDEVKNQIAHIRAEKKGA